MAHRMNLRGPWNYCWLRCIDAEQNLEAVETAKMPASWQSLFQELSGTVQFSRAFGCPTNLNRGAKVFLVLDGVGGSGTVSLNESTLGEVSTTHRREKSSSTLAGNSIRFEITQMIRQRNLVTITLTFDAVKEADTPGGLWGLVGLEIEEAEVMRS